MKSPLLHLILALVVCIATLTAYSVWYGNIAAKSTELSILQKRIGAQSTTAGQIEANKNTLAQIADDEKLVQSYFIPETGIVAFIDGLESRGRAQGATVDVLSVSPGGSSPQPVYVLSISVKGAFDSIMRTVGSIEYAPYAISISRVALGREDKSVWHADVSLTVGSRTASTTTNTP